MLYKERKRIISVIVSFCLILSLFPTSVLALDVINKADDNVEIKVNKSENIGIVLTKGEILTDLSSFK